MTEYTLESPTLTGCAVELEIAAMMAALAVASGASELRLGTFKDNRRASSRTLKVRGRHLNKRAHQLKAMACRFLAALRASGRASASR